MIKKLIEKLEHWEDNHEVVAMVLVAVLLGTATIIFWIITPK